MVTTLTNLRRLNALMRSFYAGGRDDLGEQVERIKDSLLEDSMTLLKRASDGWDDDACSAELERWQEGDGGD